MVRAQTTRHTGWGRIEPKKNSKSVCTHTNPYECDIPITIRFNLTVCMILTVLLSLPQPLCNFQWSQVSETRSIWLRKAHSFYPWVYMSIYTCNIYVCSRIYDETEWICGLRLSVCTVQLRKLW